jgi:hypothetical protein
MFYMTQQLGENQQHHTERSELPNCVEVQKTQSERCYANALGITTWPWHYTDWLHSFDAKDQH